MAAKVFRDPNNVQYDGGTKIDGVQSITVQDGSAPQVSRSEAGENHIFVPTGAVTGTITGDEGFDPNTFKHGDVAAVGLVSVSFQSAAQPIVSRGDSGTHVISVPSMHVTGTATFLDPVEAAKIAKITTAADITFSVTGRDGAAKTITITNCKTGGVGSTYSGASAGPNSVAFAGDAVSGLDMDSLANKVADAKSVTFDAKDEVGGDYTVTLTGFKSGGVSGSYTNGQAGSVTVNYAAQTSTAPTA